MIHLLVTIVYSAEYLPHLLRYYKWLGVDSFRVLVNKYGGQDLLGEVLRLSVGYPAVVEDVYEAEFYAPFKGEREREVSLRLPAHHWKLIVDCDEFHEYRPSLWACLERAGQLGHDVVCGDLADRVAADGALHPLGGDNLFGQFPVAADVTSRILLACDSKVMAYRGSALHDDGHHFALGGGHIPGSGGVVHHFKWTSTVVGRMERRHQELASRDAPWAEASGNFLDYWAAHGRFDLSDPTLNARCPLYRPEYGPPENC